MTPGCHCHILQLYNNNANGWMGAYLNVYTFDNNLVFSETLHETENIDTHQVCFSTLASDNPYTFTTTDPTAPAGYTWSLSDGWVESVSIPGTMEIDFSLG